MREGRREEFSAFAWHGEAPDPQSPETFERSRIDPALREREPNARLYALYKELIRLRKSHPVLSHLSKQDLEVKVEGDTIVMRRWKEDREVLILFNFGEEELPVPSGWKKLLDSTEERWEGRGSGGRSVKVLER